MQCVHDPMAIKIRGSRAYLLMTVVEQYRLEDEHGVRYEIVMRDPAADRDELILRSPWPGVLAEFKVGRICDIEIERYAKGTRS